MITVSRSKYYLASDAPDVLQRSDNLAQAIKMLTHDLESANNLSLRSNKVTLKTRASFVDKSHEQVEFIAQTDAREFELLKRVCTFGCEHLRESRKELIGYMVDADGNKMENRPFSELARLSHQLSTNPWRTLVVLLACELAPSIDVITRYNSYARFDDFLGLALMAWELKTTFKAVEQELA